MVSDRLVKVQAIALFSEVVLPSTRTAHGLTNMA